MKVHMTVEDLDSLLSQLKRRVEYGNMKPYVLISIGEHPNGRSFVEFEQPCEYAECTSEYHRYDEEA